MATLVWRPKNPKPHVRSLNAPKLSLGWPHKQYALRRRTRRVDEFDDADVRKVDLGTATNGSALEISLRVPERASIRLDRLLATELGISRNQVHSLWAACVLQSETDGADILRWRVRHGSRVTLDAGDLDRATIQSAACGR